MVRLMSCQQKRSSWWNEETGGANDLHTVPYEILEVSFLTSFSRAGSGVLEDHGQGAEHSLENKNERASKV